MSVDSLSGKVAIVTGGAGGLGKAIAIHLLTRGATVVICDVNSTLLDAASKELQPADRVLAIECDITKPEAVTDLFTQTISKLEKVDILVNNAAIMDRFDPAGDQDKALWDKVMAVNLTAPFLMTQAAVKHFLSREAKDAAIVNVGSLSSERGFLAGVAYTASKHGLLGLTKNTAAYYRSKGIRCNHILPGAMETNIGDSFKLHGINMDGYQLVQKSMAAIEAPITPVAEVASLVGFLCSDESAALTGAAITADKGWTRNY